MNPPTPTPTPARYDRFDLAGDFADLATTQPPTRVDTPAVGDHDARETADAVIALGRLVLKFGRVDRITYHDDGVTPESDTDHTVMLGLIACAFAAAHLPHLDLGLIAQYALVHDLVEVYAGDTPTLHPLSGAEKARKRQRERHAYQRIAAQFDATLPWLADRISGYEALVCPEARYVKALDKLLPKITHVLNDLATIREQGISAETLAARYDAQRDELRAYAADFPALLGLHADLVTRVLAGLGPATVPATP